MNITQELEITYANTNKSKSDVAKLLFEKARKGSVLAEFSSHADFIECAELAGKFVCGNTVNHRERLWILHFDWSA